MRWLKTDTKFPGKVTNVSGKRFYSVQFDDDDVDTGIEKYDMEMYGDKKLKLQVLGKSLWKSSVLALDSAMEGKKQDVNKVEEKAQVVIAVEEKQSVIVEEKQREI